MSLTRIGSLVVATCCALPVSLPGSWSEQLIGALPAGYRPPDQLRGPVQTDNTAPTSAGWWITKGGALYVNNFGGAALGSATVSFAACWVIAGT